MWWQFLKLIEKEITFRTFISRPFSYEPGIISFKLIFSLLLTIPHAR